MTPDTWHVTCDMWHTGLNTVLSLWVISGEKKSHALIHNSRIFNKMCQPSAEALCPSVSFFFCCFWTGRDPKPAKQASGSSWQKDRGSPSTKARQNGLTTAAWWPPWIWPDHWCHTPDQTCALQGQVWDETASKQKHAAGQNGFPEQLCNKPPNERDSPEDQSTFVQPTKEIRLCTRNTTYPKSEYRGCLRDEIFFGFVLRSDMKTLSNTEYIVKKAYARMWIVRRLKVLGASRTRLRDVLQKQVLGVLQLALPAWEWLLTAQERIDIECVLRTGLIIIWGEDY